MDDRHNSDADCVARARNLIARVARGVELLEDVAGLADGTTAKLRMKVTATELEVSGDGKTITYKRV